MDENNVSFSNSDIIKQILTENDYIDEIKLNAIKNLKKLFMKSNQSFSNVKIESLLENTNLLQGEKNLKKDFLFNYGLSLINFLGRNTFLEFKIIQQIESVSFKLKQQDEKMLHSLMKQLWKRLETVTVSGKLVKKFIGLSQYFLEETVLDWIEGTNQAKHFVEMSAESPGLFQAITAILYQILIKTQGHSVIMELMASFVNSVFSVCLRGQKDFIKLYPKDCRRLVTLLVIPPEMYPERGTNNNKLVTKNLVGGLILEMIFQNSNSGLMLLSHYPDWLWVVKAYHDENYN